MPLSILNLESIGTIPTSIKMSPRGFRYGFIENIFLPAAYEPLRRVFPPESRFSVTEENIMITLGGVYYDAREHHGHTDHLLDLDPLWHRALHEAASAEFIKALSENTGVACNSLRGFGFNLGKRGYGFRRPHLDGSARSKHPARTRLVAMLYLGSSPSETVGGTKIYDTDEKTIVFEAPRLYNSLLFFEQHPDAWHGYPILEEDIERKTLQFTYNLEPQRIEPSLSWGYRLRHPQALFQPYP